MRDANPSEAVLPDLRTPDMAAPPDTLRVVLPPQQIAPLSTATVTSQKPVIRFLLPTGTASAQFELCPDRACATPSYVSNVGAGPSAVLAKTLAPGVTFWRLRGIDASGRVGTTTSPVWEMFVGRRSAPLNDSWGTTLDLNGDGLADLAVGADHSDAVYVYLGAPGSTWTASTPVILRGSAGSYFGSSVASAGDLNGDGLSDLVVADEGYNTAWVYLGATGTTWEWSGPSPIPIYGAGCGHPALGSSVASAGDLNGDGLADLAVGGGLNDDAYVYLGKGGSTWSPGPAIQVIGPVKSYLGTSVAGVGDLNGDGLADLVVGDHGTATAYVYLGATGSSWTPGTPITLTGPTSFGFSVASAGDLNGDGLADLAVGTQSADAAYVYLGAAGSSWSPGAPVILSGPSGSAFGYSVAGAGDLNGDGLGDLVVGTSSTSWASAYVYVGASGVTWSGPTPITVTGPAGSRFGTSVAGAGDLNGDGFADLAVGAPGSGSCAGSAYVYAGSTGASWCPGAPNVLTGLPSFGVWVASFEGLTTEPLAGTVRGRNEPSYWAPGNPG